MLLKFALDCAIRKVQENQEGLKLNETHHYLVCIDNVNLLSKKISAMKMNAETVYKYIVRKLSICLCLVNRM